MEGPTDRQINPEIKNFEKLEWVANDLSKNMTKKYEYSDY